MDAKNLDYIRSTIELEGFSYTFEGYSDFEDIKDPEFHRLRRAYVKAARDLKDYLNIED